MPEKTLIALVDDHGLFRSGIANLLQEFPDIEVVFEAANGKELQEKIIQHNSVEVLLMDIKMPLMDGYATTAWVRDHYPLVKVLALSMFDEDLSVIKMLKAGAGGYILKESKPVELYTAIQEIKKKGIYINEMVSGKMLRQFQQEGQDGKKQTIFSEREMEFIKLCVSEYTYKEIAELMGVATRTVDNYRESLFEKLQLKSRVGLVLYAIKNGLSTI